MKMRYRKLRDSQLWTPAPFSSASQTDGITGGSQIYFHPYNEVSFKQCHILLNSSQGFPWLFFFPLDMVTTATGTQTTLFPAWRGFVGCFLQLEFNCDQMSGWQLCWGGLTHTQQDLIKLQGTLKRSEQRELEAAQEDSGAVPAPHGTGRKSIAVSLNED